MTASEHNTTAENSSDGNSRETKAVAAQVRLDLKTDIERLAYQETVPGEQNVKPSHVIRAAVRFYLENYDELDSSAFVDGKLDAEEER